MIGFAIWGIIIFIAINLYSEEENHTINPEIIYPNKKISEIQQRMFAYLKKRNIHFSIWVGKSVFQKKFLMVT